MKKKKKPILLEVSNISKNNTMLQKVTKSGIMNNIIANKSPFEQKEVKQRLPYVDKPEKFKLEIPLKIQSKIDKMCSLIHTIEWSGVLFYKIEGTLQNVSEIIIKIEDFYLMDIGSSGYTEYEYSPEYANFMCMNPHLMEDNIKIGHIHSHHNMSAFFSGTDTSELIDSAEEHKIFLSLIVCNSGNYEAKISTKVMKKTYARIVDLFKVGDTFIEREEIKNFEAEHIYGYSANIEYPFEKTLVDRINEIKNSKQVAITKVVSEKQAAFPFVNPHFPTYNSQPLYKSPSNPYIITPLVTQKEKEETSNLSVAQKKIGEDYFLKLLSCNLFFNKELFQAISNIPTNYNLEDYYVLLSNIEELLYDSIVTQVDNEQDQLELLDYILEFGKTCAYHRNQFVMKALEIISERRDTIADFILDIPPFTEDMNKPIN